MDRRGLTHTAGEKTQARRSALAGRASGVLFGLGMQSVKSDVSFEDHLVGQRVEKLDEKEQLMRRLEFLDVKEHVQSDRSPLTDRRGSFGRASRVSTEEKPPA